MKEVLVGKEEGLVLQQNIKKKGRDLLVYLVRFFGVRFYFWSLRFISQIRSIKQKQMFEWRLSSTISSCVGLIPDPSFKYTILLRYDNKFSTPSRPASIAGSKLLFNDKIFLDFSSDDQQPPSCNVFHLKFSYSCSCQPSDNAEEFIGIATINITYPLPQNLSGKNVYKFDKSLFPKANVRATFSLTRSEKKIEVNKNVKNDPALRFLHDYPQDEEGKNLKNASGKDSKKDSRKQMAPKRQSQDVQDEDKTRMQAILKERNELYKMSEDLYEQLKKCMAERDEYLRQLRQKQLSEQQIRQELDFLRLKIQEESLNGSEMGTQKIHLEEIQFLQKQNTDLKKQLQQKQIEVKELKRQVKQSFIAIDEFKKEALEARSELINKQSQMTFMTRQSKYLDPYECIQELYQQLENRRFEEPYYFKEEPQIQISIENIVSTVLKETAQLFTQIMQKMRIPKDKEWARQQKVSFEAKINALLHITNQ